MQQLVYSFLGSTLFNLTQYLCQHAQAATTAHRKNAAALLVAVEALYVEAVLDGVEFQINPATGSQISGQTYGGYRPADCPIGATNSAHKQGMAVDWYDPHDKIDAWCMANLDKMKKHGIFIEHPSKTPAWSHWSIKPPKSGKQVFYP